MHFSSAVFGVAALSSALLASSASAQTVLPLPWDGRGDDLTVDKLTDKYLTHILTMRNSSSNDDPANYVSIDQTGRDPGFNGDTGVINIGVDKDAIFKAQHNFRRSELVQFVESNQEGKTFFRASFKKDEAFLNEYQWQIIFPESHSFEIRVDATLDPPMLIYLNNGTWDAKWETEFVPGTWYNFGIAVSKGTTTNSTLEFYTSEGDAELKLAATHNTVSEFPTASYEFHIGLLTLSSDGSDPVMAAEQDVLSFNGVSVENEVSTSAASGSTSTTTSSASADADAGSEVEGDADSGADETDAPTVDATDSPATDAPSTDATPAPAATSSCARRH